ncbi:hypothetical protein B0H66DRAFT_507045 [Apodospora peruviana]|uniref:F-box domain-containing protein n=1 Tax=Apodospora peruviana TaxID=516989 RepID=A0AAE0ME91_9PEZI|nr:hypothetical protein B0H66DRAFT_507045 [Apodospora peruviana]
MRDITELPRDLFLLIIASLSPRTCIRCRAVSRQWFAAFTSQDISLLLLRWNFPRCREMRLLAAAPSASLLSSSSSSPIHNNLSVELACFARETHSWSATFASVARRYHHLRSAKPRVIEKLDLAGRSSKSSIFSFQGVATWNRYLRLDDRTANFHYPDPAWSYSREDGVLVYPAETSSSEGTGYVYQILDLATRTHVPVPFDVRQKHVRRVRLAQGVLVFEWAEALPYHQLNDREVVHRHFVTAFDVVRILSEGTGWTWTARFRSEWKLHFLGLPLNRSDRFFSAHTATHYAVYFWQPNRSLYQDDPIEQLAVWDISSPSPYRPSEDPNGDKRPVVDRALSTPTGLWNGTNGRSTQHIGLVATVSTDSLPDTKSLEKESSSSLATATAGPQVIRRMAWRELGFYNLRQRATPQLRNLALDDRNLYFVEEEHRWADGQHSSLSPPRVHMVKCTGIPIIPTPATTTTTTTSPANRPFLSVIDNSSSSALSIIIEGPVLGPMWVDSCCADGDVNMNFCRRIAPATASIEHFRDFFATASLSTIAAFTTSTSPQRLREVLHLRSAAFANGWPWTEVSPQFGKETIPMINNNIPSLLMLSQPQRWPGWAPCWRHDDFPYLTVAEMVDFAAGVRVTARHCFMLETLSVHVRPASISVKGAPPLSLPGSVDDSDDDDDTELFYSAISGEQSGSTSGFRRRRKRKPLSTAGDAAGRTEEVHFSDDMWSQLLAKGHIAGDERWIVGEEEGGRVTIVRF